MIVASEPTSVKTIRVTGGGVQVVAEVSVDQSMTRVIGHKF
jgi:hypothetical protein